MLTRTLALFTLLLLILPSCKKTVEGETKAWTRNTQKATELSAVYPGFKKPLAEQLKQARAAMEAAKKITDQEAAAKAMAAANSMLASGWVGKLSSVDYKIKKVRDKMVTATTGTRDKNDRMAARNAARDARRVLEQAQRKLRAGAADITTASVLVPRIYSDVYSAESRLDRVIRAAKKKQKKGKKGKSSVSSGKGAPGAAAPAGKPAAARWKCEYCDKMSASSASKCNNCGAARP